MKVFKFGGASLKDAEAVRNMCMIMQRFVDEEVIVVVSAMGKTTNTMERFVNAIFHKGDNAIDVLKEIKDYHFNILNELFPNEKDPIHNEIHNLFVELDWALDGIPTLSYDREYDQMVGIGELISSRIIAAYLNERRLNCKWWDIRDLIKTDETFREGKVNWEETEKNVKLKVEETFSPFAKNKLVVTQGFLGSTSENFTTTLGREGSDYTAAILGYCAGADSVTIWKDVPGVLNADPKWFDETKLIEQLNYQDAIELSYYGASVIHPKTIKPLQNKNIPLYVKSFLKPNEKGTTISNERSALPIPCFIFKVNQLLISLSPKDFSFIVEENFSEIFKLFAERGVKINTMQNSAISFSLCVDNDGQKIPGLIERLQHQYRVLYNDKVELITIRYYDQATVDRVSIGKKILLEVKSRYTVQLVVKDSSNP